MKEEATRFMRIPFFTTGHLVTEKNMEAVSGWCGGHIIEKNSKRFIRVPVHNARSVAATEAHIGSWVIKSTYNNQESFKVYRSEWLPKNFLSKEDMTPEWIAQLLMQVSSMEGDEEDALDIPDDPNEDAPAVLPRTVPRPVPRDRRPIPRRPMNSLRTA